MITVKDRESFLEAMKLFILPGASGAEIGVYKGDFSEMILKHLNPKYLMLIDPFESKDEPRYSYDLGSIPVVYSGGLYEGVVNRFSQRIYFEESIAIYRRYSYEVVQHFDDSMFDFIYLDGSHLYQDVKRDLNDYLPKMKPSSLVCGHDYIDEPSFGVIRAVDEFCKEYNFEKVIFNENGGDYALKRKETL